MPTHLLRDKVLRRRDDGCVEAARGGSRHNPTPLLSVLLVQYLDFDH